MEPPYNTEEQYQALCLEKALKLYGQYIVSAGLEAQIPPDEIGYRFLGVVDNDEDWVDFKAHFGELLKSGQTIEVRMNETQFFFDRRD